MTCSGRVAVATSLPGPPPPTTTSPAASSRQQHQHHHTTATRLQPPTQRSKLRTGLRSEAGGGAVPPPRRAFMPARHHESLELSSAPHRADPAEVRSHLRQHLLVQGTHHIKSLSFRPALALVLVHHGMRPWVLGAFHVPIDDIQASSSKARASPPPESQARAGRRASRSPSPTPTIAIVGAGLPEVDKGSPGEVVPGRGRVPISFSLGFFVLVRRFAFFVSPAGSPTTGCPGSIRATACLERASAARRSRAPCFTPPSAKKLAAAWFASTAARTTSSDALAVWLLAVAIGIRQGGRRGGPRAWQWLDATSAALS